MTGLRPTSEYPIRGAEREVYTIALEVPSTSAQNGQGRPQGTAPPLESTPQRLCRCPAALPPQHRFRFCSRRSRHHPFPTSDKSVPLVYGEGDPLDGNGADTPADLKLRWRRRDLRAFDADAMAKEAGSREAKTDGRVPMPSG